MATRYARGRQFEYRVRDKYAKKGWFTIRSAGSKGVADIVAIHPAGIIHFIQCKNHGAISREERIRLAETAYKYGALPIVAQQGHKRGQIMLVVLNPDGSKSFATDDVSFLVKGLTSTDTLQEPAEESQ
jgi:Holliday junction resolvase